MCKIVVFDNYPLFSSGLSSILRGIADFDIVCEARQADQVRLFTSKIKPDVIIINILHMENGGIKPIRKIRRYCSKTPILLILSEFYNIYFEEYIRLGVKGFVFNDAKPEELIVAVKKLSKGQDFFRNQVWMILKDTIRSKESVHIEKNNSKLTDREIAVLKHFCQGLTFKEIGDKLNISSRTVESHKKNILAKLNLKSTVEMVKYALVNNIVG